MLLAKLFISHSCYFCKLISVCQLFASVDVSRSLYFVLVKTLWQAFCVYFLTPIVNDLLNSNVYWLNERYSVTNRLIVSKSNKKHNSEHFALIKSVISKSYLLKAAYNYEVKLENIFICLKIIKG